MRVFLAGGSGVIGRPLIRQLVAAGHVVVATTQSPAKVALLEQLGATAVVMDAFDGGAVRKAVIDAKPEAVMHQLTALPPKYDPTKPAFYEKTTRLRGETTEHLVQAARDAGAGRFIFQSICFMHEFKGPMVLDETAPIQVDAPGHVGEATRATLRGEALATATEGLTGVVLRYGQLYGPGTYFSPEGDFGRRARKRMLPIVGDGGGTFSFLHVEDAASAAATALEKGEGVYNIADDEPAPAREWIPVFCEAVGAPRPLRIPLWLARLVAGRTVADGMANFRGSTSEKAKRELGWRPGHPTWRRGFYEIASAGSSTGGAAPSAR